MITVISATPLIDTAQYAEKLARDTKSEWIKNPTKVLCNALGYQTLYDIPQPFQNEVRLRLLNEHLAQLEQNKGKVLVLDFSVFEWLADWMRWAWAHSSSEAFEAVHATAGKIISLYDKVVHLESGALREYDGYVWRDAKNAKQIERLLRALYTDFDLAGKLTVLKSA